MPKKITTQEVIDRFRRYGYDVIDPNFRYRNNQQKVRVRDVITERVSSMSLNQLRYYATHGRSEFNENDYYQAQLPNIALTNDEPRDGFQRWRDHQERDIQEMDDNEQHRVFDSMHSIQRKLLSKQKFEIDNVDLRSFIEAARNVCGRLGDYNVRLTFKSDSGRIDYRHLNPNTINFLTALFNQDEFDQIADSGTVALSKLDDYKNITVEFVKKKDGKRVVAGFFPFLNKSEIDLKRYGIYSSTNDPELKESCLYTAFKNSGLFSTNELLMLKSFVKTRYIPQTEFKTISELLKVKINVKYDNTHNDYGEDYSRQINLCILYGHYMLDDDTKITENFITHYDEIQSDNRFKNHPRKYLLKSFSENRYSFSKSGMKIRRLLNTMIETQLLVPMTASQISKLDWSFKPQEVTFEGFARSIFVKDVKNQEYKLNHPISHTKHFFGYECQPEDEEKRLQELQDVVDSLNLRTPVNVKLYYKFSELMQKIMYEFGCYDDVYEFCGDKAKDIRSQCKFPRTRTFNDRPLYLKQKLYYIDLNGAYMSAVKSIPTGIDLKGENTKISELIQKLYDIRKKSNPYLARTLKFLMNSCWGYSIQRKKTIKHKYTKNLQNYLETFAPFVLKYTDSGFVDTINSFVPHWTCPQFALSVLTNFEKIMNGIKSKVNVLYENIDAILISEEDFIKLKNEGLIGNELGQFKIEHIFTEIAIKSPRLYIARLEDGNLFHHQVPETTDFDTFASFCH